MDLSACCVISEGMQSRCTLNADRLRFWATMLNNITRQRSPTTHPHQISEVGFAGCDVSCLRRRTCGRSSTAATSVSKAYRVITVRPVKDIGHVCLGPGAGFCL